MPRVKISSWMNFVLNLVSNLHSKNPAWMAYCERRELQTTISIPVDRPLVLIGGAL